MKSTVVTIAYSAHLRVENAPDHHHELTRRLGPPAICLDGSTEAGSGRWLIESPLSRDRDINEHFAWASALIEQHSDYLHQLVASGVRVTLQLACHTNLDYALIGFDTHLFGPFVHAGIAIEFHTGLGS